MTGSGVGRIGVGVGTGVTRGSGVLAAAIGGCFASGFDTSGAGVAFTTPRGRGVETNIHTIAPNTTAKDAQAKTRNHIGTGASSLTASTF